MNKKVLLAAGISSVVLLSGCASGPDEETMSQISALNGKIDQLSREVASLRQSQSRTDMKALEAQKAATAAQESAFSAQEEAIRANERIDNIAQSYTK
ncbi:Lpp/OprI family alanine-zipper lipoprotein [Vibrio sp. SCSIO 43137]|uniref:Lpp/OprI family alanine-zipper lipoprotein n=1 Tax=Vibrio sp. SCSIO 43137 TaxID=3021011 RepID=UPI002306FADB|nr:Lpp/OprI family alanine-zipper lipoprotein [Vibrio sp. SCSIO 43137]WCE31945.1 Lpp/OprI family alanine-zipper lipoprotein [Vibrio sp. SCSIO 43137]